jgi:hypothetical protein
MKKRKQHKEVVSLVDALLESGVVTAAQARELGAMLADGRDEEAGKFLEKILESQDLGPAPKNDD